MNQFLNLMSEHETDSPTQAQQLAELIESEGGSMKRDEMLERVDFIPSETRLDNVLSNMVGREELKRDESIDGLYMLPEKVENKTVSEPTEKNYPSVQADQSTAMSSNGHEQLPFLDGNELTEVQPGDEPLPQGVDEHLLVDNRLIKTVDESRKQAVARVPGNSMDGVINAEDQVVIEIEENIQITQGAIYMWVNSQGGVIIMRAHWLGGKTLRLVPENDNYPITELEGERGDWDWSCIARVTQVLSGV